MHKVLSRDMWHYRKMTDGVKDKEKEDTGAVKEEPNGPFSEEPYKGISLDEVLFCLFI